MGISGTKAVWCAAERHWANGSQRERFSGMTRFLSYNILINDLAIKISLMLIECSGDAILGSILDPEARNSIAEDLGDLDTSRSD